MKVIYLDLIRYKFTKEEGSYLLMDFKREENGGGASARGVQQW